MADMIATPAESPQIPETETNRTDRSALNIPLVPSTVDVIVASFRLPTIPRFFHLLTHTKFLINTYGPHTTGSRSKIFARAPIPHSGRTENSPSARLLATSLATAQDLIHTPQPAGPAKNDLQAFKLLWDVTIDVLENILEDANIDHESFGWGVFALTSGYMTWTPSANPSASLLETDPAFISLRKRLRSALLNLPSLSSPEHGRESLVVSGAERVYQLARARRETHVCASLLVQRVRAEGWSRVRWWHGIAVAERWIGNLGLAGSCKGQEEEESGHEV